MVKQEEQKTKHRKKRIKGIQIVNNYKYLGTMLDS